MANAVSRSAQRSTRSPRRPATRQATSSRREPIPHRTTRWPQSCSVPRDRGLDDWTLFLCRARVHAYAYTSTIPRRRDSDVCRCRCCWRGGGGGGGAQAYGGGAGAIAAGSPSQRAAGLGGALPRQDLAVSVRQGSGGARPLRRDADRGSARTHTHTHTRARELDRERVLDVDLVLVVSLPFGWTRIRRRARRACFVLS